MSLAIVELDVAREPSDVTLSPRQTGVALVVRHAGKPAGFLMLDAPAGSTVKRYVLKRILAGVGASRSAPWPARRAARLPAPPLTVAVCTKDRPADLETCLGQLLALRQRGADFELLVVDNAPSDDRTRDVVAALDGTRYVREPRAGLDVARNRALREASGELVAFVDDDVAVDDGWMEGLRHGLRVDPDAGAVTGLVLPLELETDAQVLFERRGGFEKRFETTRFGATLPGHPFYPCVGGMLGTGCNMAVRRRLALELGGFDEALDAGAALPGGGDSDMLYRIVRAGRAVVYEPSMLVFHRHRREMSALRRQYCWSWGQGLMAFVAKTWRTEPDQRPKLRRLILSWLARHVRGTLSSVLGGQVRSASMHLAELRGGLVGLTVAYPRSVRRMREAASSAR